MRTLSILVTQVTRMLVNSIFDLLGIQIKFQLLWFLGTRLHLRRDPGSVSQQKSQSLGESDLESKISQLAKQVETNRADNSTDLAEVLTHLVIEDLLLLLGSERSFNVQKLNELVCFVEQLGILEFLHLWRVKISNEDVEDFDLGFLITEQLLEQRNDHGDDFHLTLPFDVTFWCYWGVVDIPRQHDSVDTELYRYAAEHDGVAHEDDWSHHVIPRCRAGVAEERSVVENHTSSRIDSRSCPRSLPVATVEILVIMISVFSIVRAHDRFVTDIIARPEDMCFLELAATVDAATRCDHYQSNE